MLYLNLLLKQRLTKEHHHYLTKNLYVERAYTLIIVKTLISNQRQNRDIMLI